MKNLEEIITKIEKNIDDKEKVREIALRYSRTIIIFCRKSIQHLHQGHFKESEELITQASKVLSDLSDETKNYPDLSNAGFVENASQEFVEANCLLNILLEKDLPDPDELHTSYTSYLEGLCDVVGELRRKAIDSVLNGEAKEAYSYLINMEAIYDAILRFDYPASLIPIKRKQDITRSLIEKTRGELAVASCEQRIEYRTDEFRALLDEMNKEKAQQSQQKKQDLDIDRIW
ncbi:MAG: RNA-binding protein [Candidatus Thermoplasmatota archaeon]|nr:RNA-binding protein [Candidatus Thermoplasmatota archaeon]